MTVAELIERLRELPGDAELRPVFVRMPADLMRQSIFTNRAILDVSSSWGNVFIDVQGK